MNWAFRSEYGFDRKIIARFGSTYTKIGMIQRLAWPLIKDDMQINEAFHMFVCLFLKKDNS